MVGRRRFLTKHVQGGAGQVARAQRLGQRSFVDDAAARAIKNAAAGFHQAELTGADQVASLLVQRCVYGDKVAAWQELIEVREAFDAELSGALG